MSGSACGRVRYAAMDILDRLLRHDAWTTRQILVRCRELSGAQLDQPFDAGNGSLRATLLHIIENMEVWTDLIYERSVRERGNDSERGRSVDGLIERLDAVAPDLARIGTRLAAEGRLDDLWTDHLDDPPTQKTFGGAIAHVITHSHQHRAEALHMLQRLGVQDLIEGDVLGWEQQARREGS
jgi:uncharacterized damage-inducible protein DinB